MKAREITASLRLSAALLVYKLSTNMLFLARFTPTFWEFSLTHRWICYANYVRIDGSLLITLVRIIFHAKFPYLICTLSEWILYIVARENSVSYTIVVAARSIAVYTGSLAKKSILACDAKKTKKRELESDQTIFWDVSSNHFLRAKK